VGYASADGRPAACIIAIFLGIMGVLGGAMGIVGLLIDQKSIRPARIPS
jgi:hypothetical protein